jgi:transposase InsO family protein
LDTVLDMASRRVVGFALGEHHDANLAYAALAMAVAVRGGRDAIAGVILHADQGSEYTAGLVRAACDRLGIRQSMGRTGSALDNAVIESWHSTVEFELRRLEHFATKAEARAGVAAWDRGVQPRPAPLGRGHALTDRLRAQPRQPGRPRPSRRRDRPLPATHRGAVLAGVKAKPCGVACGQP